jgi:uncharacterized Zn-binding protein involved in type VI secretion
VGILDGGLSSDVQIMGMAAATVDSTATNTPSHIPTPPGTVIQKPPTNKATVFMGSATVLINGKPAARMGDVAMTCNDPADLPVGTVMGTAATVLIGGPPSKAGSGASGSSGSGGGGSGGAGEGEAEGQGEGALAPATSQAGSTAAKDEEAKDFIEFTVKDAKGNAITDREYELMLPDGTRKKGKLDGAPVREDDIQPGPGALRLKGLYDPRWSHAVAGVGEEVELRVEAACYDDGTPIKLEVYREHVEGSGDAVATFQAKVQQGTAHAKWKYEYEPADAGSRPRFVFHAVVESERAVSDALEVGDVLEATLEDTQGHVLGNLPVTLFGCDGQERTERTDPKGKLLVKGLAFGKCVLRLEDGNVIEEVKS